MSSYKIFYINLDRSVDRKKAMIEQFNKNFKNVTIERFSAVDKNNLSDEYVKSILNPRYYYYMDINNHKRTIHEDLNTKGHIGCFLSHIDLWKKLLKDNTVENYVIFEDDVKIKSSLQSTIENQIFYDKVEFDFISLIYITRRNNNTFSKYTNFYKLENPFWGMQCYIISKSGAQALVKWSNDLFAQIDAYVGYVSFYENMRAYMYKESLGSTGGFISELDHGNCLYCNGDESFNIKIKTMFMYPYKTVKNNIKYLNYYILILLSVLLLYLACKSRK